MNAIEHLDKFLYVKNVLSPLILATFDDVGEVVYVEQCGGQYGSIKVTYKDHKDRYINITDCNKHKDIALKALFNI